MSRYIDAEWLMEYFKRGKEYKGEYVLDDLKYDAPHINLDDYVPRDFHDRTCEAMAKAHQEEIADMVSVVRCKECYMCDEEMWCSFFDSIMESDDFCSYGERSE